MLRSVRSIPSGPEKKGEAGGRGSSPHPIKSTLFRSQSSGVVWLVPPREVFGDLNESNPSLGVPNWDSLVRVPQPLLAK